MKTVTSLSKKIRAGILLSTILFILLFILPVPTLLAQVMQSSTYKITSDSVNVGGLNNSGSASYNMGDTLGEVGTGDSSSANYALHAGFWQMQESYISISSPADLALTHMGGLPISGEATEGTLSWLVTTDNTAGYSMNIQTGTTPALTRTLGGDSFSDYTLSGANPDYTFTLSSPTTSAFGFSPEGVDTNARFLDNGTTCNTGGSGETIDKCWDGLSLSPKIIATRASSNQPGGSTVTVRFHAESGASHIQLSGAYSASITVTAITL